MFEALERILERAKERFKNDPRFTVDKLANVFLQGRTEGYRIHAKTQSLSEALTGSQGALWVDQATEYAEETLERFQEVIEPLETIEAISAVAAVTAFQGVWRGHDNSVDEIKQISGSESKEWFRAIGRENPRDWHDDLNGLVIPYDDLFTLTGGKYEGVQVLSPRDWQRVNDPSEWAFCGHAIILR